MGLKRIFRKLTCRPVTEADEENGLRKSDSLLGQNETEKSGSSSRRKPRAASSAWKKKQAQGEGNESRYMSELEERDLFTIREYNGKYIDIPASFTPQPKGWMVLLKLVIFLCIAYMTVGEFAKSFPKAFYFATFDHWALTVTVIYLFMSLLSNAMRKPSKDLEFASERYLPSLWRKITWVLFEIAAPSQLLATLAFWMFDFDGEDPEIMLMVHGIVLILLLTEGLGLNRIPIRINHQWFFLGFVYAFLLWTLIHSYTSIGNPMKVGDAISLYPFLQWNRAPIWAAFSAILILFLVAPAAYWLIWRLSLFSVPWRFTGRHRRYLSPEDKKALESYVEPQE